MKKLTLMFTALAVLLFVGMAQAMPTAQQSCDYARITAWKKYVTCVENVVAKDAKGVDFDEFAAFARCRHTYFKNWSAFQSKTVLAGSTCVGARFVDNGNQTVTDNLTALVWINQQYDGSWSTGAPYAENGTVFSSLLPSLNDAGGFAGANGWRLPTVIELHTIVLDFPCRGAGMTSTCSCPSYPCVDPSLAGSTLADIYWSGTTYLPSPDLAWLVAFNSGSPDLYDKRGAFVLARPVRAGM